MYKLYSFRFDLFIGKRTKKDEAEDHFFQWLHLPKKDARCTSVYKKADLIGKLYDLCVGRAWRIGRGSGNTNYSYRVSARMVSPNGFWVCIVFALIVHCVPNRPVGSSFCYMVKWLTRTCIYPRGIRNHFSWNCNTHRCPKKNQKSAKFFGKWGFVHFCGKWV